MSAGENVKNIRARARSLKFLHAKPRSRGKYVSDDNDTDGNKSI